MKFRDLPVLKADIGQLDNKEFYSKWHIHRFQADLFCTLDRKIYQWGGILQYWQHWFLQLMVFADTNERFREEPDIYKLSSAMPKYLDTCEDQHVEFFNNVVKTSHSIELFNLFEVALAEYRNSRLGLELTFSSVVYESTFEIYMKLINQNLNECELTELVYYEAGHRDRPVLIIIHQVMRRMTNYGFEP